MKKYDEVINVEALDDGYGDFKYDSKGVPSLVPSFVTPFKPKPRDDFNSSGKDLRYVASEIDGYRYVVGDYAMKLDSNIKWTGGENKHSDTRFPIMLKTTLALMSTSSHRVIDTLMMNLPIKYDTDDRRKTLTDIVRGTHVVSISDDGIHFQEKTITVAHVDIKKQPFGSICDVMLDQNGDILNKEVAKGFNVVVDIGARTLNILTVDALEEQPELTTQTNDGMFTSYTQIGNFLETELGVLIPDGKLPIVIRNKELKGRDLTPLINQVYQNQANTILNVLDKVLINSWAFVNNIIFTGGGAEVLKPYLIEAVRNSVNTMFLGRFSNVGGLRKYGIRQMRKRVKSSSIQIKVGSDIREYNRK